MNFCLDHEPGNSGIHARVSRGYGITAGEMIAYLQRFHPDTPLCGNDIGNITPFIDNVWFEGDYNNPDPSGDYIVVLTNNDLADEIISEHEVAIMKDVASFYQFSQVEEV